MRLSPHDPQMFSMRNAIACAHFVTGRYAEALAMAEIAMRERPNFILPFCIAATSAVHAGRMKVAQAAMDRLRQIGPDVSISNFGEVMGFMRVDDTNRWVAGFRK